MPRRTSAFPLDGKNFGTHRQLLQEKVWEKFLVIRSGSVDRNPMSTVMEIEKAIEKLPTDELFELTHWISLRFSDAWDRQIEIDIRSGRLDDLAAEALQEHRAGGSQEFPLDE
jgi:hypothetical protein